MKVEYFVDEMPRDCASCKHYHMNCADGYSCSKLRKEIHPNFSEGMGYRIKDCPLQSLTDYTKQVRKEVCDKIYDLLTTGTIWRPMKTTWSFTNDECEELRKLLDQIQGEIE